MKILFDHPNPFLLAHGGFQTQIEQTKSGLESIGVDVSYLRWWDSQQRAEIIHYFGRPTSDYIQLAHKKNIKVIVAPLLTGLGSRSMIERAGQKLMMRSFEVFLPHVVVNRFNWDSFQSADACIALTTWEAQLMGEMFRAALQKTHVVENGVEPIFFENGIEERGPWLVCTATITERKRVLELARAAVAAQIPLWILGKPYSDSDSYAQEFLALVRKSSKLLRYEGAISDRTELARIYRQARGFVLLSKMESLSLSALEASACRCPLLLSDLPWAKTVFKETASYCPITRVTKVTAKILRAFYDSCPKLAIPPKPKTWIEVAQQLKRIYEALLRTSA